MKTVKTRLFLSRRGDVLTLLGRQLPVRDLGGGGGQVNWGRVPAYVWSQVRVKHLPPSPDFGQFRKILRMFATLAVVSRPK
jgi:hypothetical protein